MPKQGSASAPSISHPEPGASIRAAGAASDYAWRRNLLALAVAAMGAVDLLSALLSRPSDRLLAIERLVPTDVLDSSRTFTLLAGALLLVTAWGLRRGKRRAYVTALFLCALSVPVNMLKALDLEEATVATALMFVLGMSADAFRVKSRELSLRVLRSGAIWGTLALLVYAMVGAWVVESQVGVRPTLHDMWRDTATTLFGLGEPIDLPHGLKPGAQRILIWYLNSLPLLSLTLLVSIALASLRPAVHRGRHRAESGRVADLLARYGASSVSWFTLGADVDYFFSRNRRAVIAYKFENDTLLAIGDPIGPREEIRPLLEEFALHCRDRDWQFAFFQARPDLLPVYQALGWRALHIGEDPVLWTERFTLEGGAIGGVRRAVHKAEAASVVVRHFIPDAAPFDAAHAPAGWEDELREISDDWLRNRRGGEKGFCMGRFDAHHLHEAWVAVAFNENAGRVEGFMTWVPIPARQGWALDLTRRRANTLPGVMELIVARSVEAARARGDTMLSLSLSALASVGAAPDAPSAAEASTEPAPAPIRPVRVAPKPEVAEDPDRARAFLMEHLARFYDFKGLFQWKRKFVPEFEDRYLVYSSPLALPRVAIALIRAQSSGGLMSYFHRTPPAPGPPPAGPSAGPHPTPATTPDALAGQVGA